MPAPSRHRLQIDERRTQLLELGRDLFAENAYDDVSIDHIAEAAGISKGLLYHYFGSKRAFYIATVREAASQLTARTAPDLALPTAQRALAGIEAYLDFVEENARSYPALLRSGVGNDPEVARIVEDTRDAIVARMMTNMGFVAPRPIFRFALRGWIGLVEATSLDWLERREVSREMLLQTLLESLAGVVGIAMRFDPDSGFSLGGEPAVEAVRARAVSDPTDAPANGRAKTVTAANETATATPRRKKATAKPKSKETPTPSGKPSAKKPRRPARGRR
jgi:AcrR family transcriptional regulator